LWVPRLKKAIIAASTSIIVLCFCPSGKDIVALGAFHELDKYNDNNPKSNLSPQKALELIDHTLTNIDAIINGGLVKAKEALEEKEAKKVEKVEKTLKKVDGV